MSLTIFEAWNNEFIQLLTTLLDLSKTFIAHKKQVEYFNCLSILHGSELTTTTEEEKELVQKIEQLNAGNSSSIKVDTKETLPILPSLDNLSEADKKELETLSKSWFDAWVNNTIHLELVSAIHKSRRLLYELSCNEGWQLVRSSKDTHTYYRPEEGLPTHSFKITGIANVDLMSLFSVIYEADLYKEWFPFMSDTKELASPARFTKICQAVVGAPWPLYDREFVMEAFGVDNTEEGRVLINIASLPSTGHPSLPNGGQLPAVPKGAYRCQMHLGGYMLEILSKTTTRISFYTNLDPELAVIPTSLLNHVTGKLVHTIVEKMEDMAKNVQNPKYRYAARRSEKSEIYDDVQKIVDQVFVALDDTALTAAETKAETEAEESKE